MSTLQNSDQNSMVNALKKGNEKAYRMLYDQYYDMLCALAYQYVKDDFIAESIVGDVVFNIWEHRKTLEIHTSLKAYLIKSVRNRCINYLEHLKVKRQSEQILEQQHSKQQKEYFSDIDYPLAKIITMEMEESLAKAITALPDECREVFRLCRMEELSYAEVSAQLHISVNTVKYHMKNALAQLREQFKDYLPILAILFYI